MNSLISGKIIIGNLIDQFNIKSDDWIGRAPNWIAKALNHITDYYTLVDALPVELAVSDGKIIIPDDMAILVAIFVDDVRVNLLTDNTSILNSKNKTSYNFYYIDNGYIYVSKDECTIKIHYKKVPTVYDESFQVTFPLIPNKEEVIDNITWYCFKNILSRGYIHNIYALGNRNQEYDPNFKWQQTKLSAKIAINTMNFDERLEISNVFTTFLDSF